MSDDTELCGADTADGEPCQLPASRDDGRCHNHTDIEAENARGGRPTKLSTGRQENIAHTIERGHSMKAAARAHGIHPATMFEWMSQGEADKDAGRTDTPHAQFYDRITRARGESERQYVDEIRQIAADTDDAAMLMTMLKQRHPDSWGEANASEQKGGGVNVFMSPDSTTHINPDTLEVEGETDADDDPDEIAVDATVESESQSQNEDD